jgi:hypothetical protein
MSGARIEKSKTNPISEKRPQLPAGPEVAASARARAVGGMCRNVPSARERAYATRADDHVSVARRSVLQEEQRFARQQVNGMVRTTFRVGWVTEAWRDREGHLETG